MLDLDQAIKISKETYVNIDYIEAGTPLIKNNGRNAIIGLKKEFPDKLVIADMKTIDTAERDCTIAFEGGADGIIVQAVAPRETIEKAANIAKRKNKQVMLDALGMKDIETLNHLVSLIDPDHTILHIGIDEQETHDLSMLFDMANIAGKHRYLSSIALAGGISSQLLKKCANIPQNVNIFIVGASITSISKPAVEASAIKNLIKTI